jgi:hypothetical protein
MAIPFTVYERESVGFSAGTTLRVNLGVRTAEHPRQSLMRCWSGMLHRWRSLLHRVNMGSPVSRMATLLLYLPGRHIAIAPTGLAALAPAWRPTIIAVPVTKVVAVTPQMMPVFITVVIPVPVAIVLAPLFSMVAVVVFVMASTLGERRSQCQRHSQQHYESDCEMFAHEPSLPYRYIFEALGG